jgi:hypothetical protein
LVDGVASAQQSDDVYSALAKHATGYTAVEHAPKENDEHDESYFTLKSNVKKLKRRTTDSDGEVSFLPDTSLFRKMDKEKDPDETGAGAGKRNSGAAKRALGASASAGGSSGGGSASTGGEKRGAGAASAKESSQCAKKMKELSGAEQAITQGNMMLKMLTSNDGFGNVTLKLLDGCIKTLSKFLDDKKSSMFTIDVFDGDTLNADWKPVETRSKVDECQKEHSFGYDATAKFCIEDQHPCHPGMVNMCVNEVL